MYSNSLSHLSEHRPLLEDDARSGISRNHNQTDIGVNILVIIRWLMVLIFVEKRYLLSSSLSLNREFRALILALSQGRSISIPIYRMTVRVGGNDRIVGVNGNNRSRHEGCTYYVARGEAKKRSSAFANN